MALPTLFTLLTILAVTSTGAATNELLPLRYEAEQQGLSDGDTVIADGLASAGQAVRLGDSGEIQWSVVAPAAGRYELWLRYRASDGDKAARVVVNGRELGLGLPRTLDEWAEIRFIRTLAAGTNTIILRKDWPDLEVDYLRFGFLGGGEPRPLVEWPVISPRNNLRYLRSPAETRLKVDLGGHRLLGIHESGRNFNFTQTRCEYLDDAIQVHLPAADFDGVKPGILRLTLQFDHGMQVPYDLDLRKKPEQCPWTIVTLDVNHGGATFMRLPGGKTLLLDTAKAEEAHRVIIPFLATKVFAGNNFGKGQADQQVGPAVSGITPGSRSNLVGKLDYLIITHYHEDHVGGLPEIQKRLSVGQFWDYKSFKVGDEFAIDGVKVKVLNAYESGEEENTRSLALRFEYHGFVYTHGADNYAVNQLRQLAQFSPETLRAHVYHANHHFHGSVDAGFLRTMDPVLVLVSAEQAVYARGAFTTIFKQDVESYLKTANRRLREALLTYDVGHIILRITDADHWSCETTPTLDGIVLPWR